MYCIDTEALALMFNGGSPNGFTIHLINNKKHVYHGFLAPRPYLCCTSINICVFEEMNERLPYIYSLF